MKNLPMCILAASFVTEKFVSRSFSNQHSSDVKLDFKELLNKEQIDFQELFTDYQLFFIP